VPAAMILRGPQAVGVPHARIHHATPGTWAKLETPRAFLEKPLPELPAMPAGIAEHLSVERTGAIEGFPAWAEARVAGAIGPANSSTRFSPRPISMRWAWSTAPASLPSWPRASGASLRSHLLRARCPSRWSRAWRTEHRRIYYFANASREEKLLHARAGPILPAPAAAPSRVRTMGRFSSAPICTAPRTRASWPARWSRRPARARADEAAPDRIGTPARPHARPRLTGMVFTSNIFIFYFLPLVLLLYYALPFRYRNALLTWRRTSSTAGTSRGSCC
jgi:hypothetical protein